MIEKVLLHIKGSFTENHQRNLDQKGFYHLDSEPQTLAAKAHRCAYGKDGDYFSKPSIEDVFEKVYKMMHEVNPEKYPELY